MIQFNNAYLKYDQQGFQQILFVGVYFYLKLDSLNDSCAWFFCLNVLALSKWKSITSIIKRRLLSQ